MVGAADVNLAELTRFSLEATVGISKPWRNFVGKMPFGIQDNQDVNLGNRPKTVSITAHLKERLNSILGALACSTSTVR